MNHLSRAAVVAASLVAVLAACAPNKLPAEPLHAAQPRLEARHALRVGGDVPVRRVEVGQAVCDGDTPAIIDDVESALGGDCQRAESIARQENPK